MKSAHKHLAACLTALAVSAASIPETVLTAFANTFETAKAVKTVDTIDLNFREQEPYENIWIRFTAPEDGTYTFQSTGPLDTRGYLYKDKDTELRSDDDSADDGMNFLLQRSMFAGDVIYVAVSSGQSNDTVPEDADCKLVITSEEMNGYDKYTHYSDEEGCGVSGDLVYQVEDDNTVSIIGCYWKAKNVKIPAKIDGKPVTSIQDCAFADYSAFSMSPRNEGIQTLETVEMADTITEIGNMDGYWNYGAFRGCTALRSVKLSANLKSLGDDTFAECTSLTSVTLPDGLEYIGGGAFSGCEKLTKLNIPDTLLSYSNFTSGTGLDVVTEDGITYYQNWIVGAESDSNKKELVIKNGTKGISAYAFNSWSRLESVTIPESVLCISHAAFGNGDPWNADSNLAMDYLKTVTIEGENLRSIGDFAFCCVKPLTNFTIPDSVVNIGEYAFAFSGLQSARLPKNLERLGAGAYSGVEAGYIIIPDGMKTLGPSIFGGIPTIILPDTVESVHPNFAINYNSMSISADVFYTGTEEQLRSKLASDDEAPIQNNEKSLITGATVHYNSKLVEQDGCTYAVSDGEAILLQANTAAEEYTFPAEIEGAVITKIGAFAFKNCNELKTLVIPDTVKEVGNDAFDHCESMTSISFPKGISLPLKSIGYYVEDHYYLETNGIEDLFDGCSSLEEIAFDADDPTYFTSGGNVYLRDPQVLLLVPETASELNVADGTVAVAYCAVEGCRKLTVWNGLPESVTAIGSKAFYNTGLTSIVIPDTVTKLVGYSLCLMPELESAVLPNGLAEIPNNLFGGDTKLKKVSIPDSVTYIDSEAFYNCISLRQLTVPDSVTRFGYDVFCGTDPETNRSVPLADLKLYGSAGSKTQQYAMQNGLKFYPLANDSVFAADGEEKTYENLKYGFAKDGTIVITGCTEDAEVLDIPAEIDGIKVTAIEPYAFMNSETITAANIPDSVTNIGFGAFYACTSLTSVQLPAKLTVIDSYVFSECESLNEISLPDTVKEIRASAFASCYKLPELALPSALTTIGNAAFQNCNKLTIPAFPQNLETIGDYAFSCDYNAALVPPTLPDSLKSVGRYAFNECGQPEELHIPKSLTAIPEGAFYFSFGSDLKAIYIPATVKEIGYHAFIINSKTKIYYDGTEKKWNQIKQIPDEYGKIDPFDSQEYVLYFSDDTELRVGNGTSDQLNYHYNVDRTVTITGIHYTYSSEDVFPEVLEIPAEIDGAPVTEIGAEAFYEYNEDSLADIHKIVLPDTITKIGREAFENMIGLTEINIPDGVTVIENETFEKCKALQKINIPDGVTSIGSYAFSDCEALQEISIPDGVTSIGSSAFYDCEALQEITIPDSVTFIDYDAFAGCKALQKINIPDGVTVIKEETFSDCEALQSITIPDSVKSIDFRAFSGSGLTGIVIPESVTEFGIYILGECTALKTVSIPSTVTRLSALFDENEENHYDNLTDITYNGTQEQWAALMSEFEEYSSDTAKSIRKATVHFADGSSLDGEAAATTAPAETTTTTTVTTTTTTESTETTTTTTTEPTETTTTTTTTEPVETTAITTTKKPAKTTTTAESTEEPAETTETESTAMPVETTAPEESAETTTLPDESTTAAETTTTASDEPAEAPAGDYNGDGEVTIADAVLLARFAAEDSELTEEQVAGVLNGEPDQDGDGLITLLDVKAILRKLGSDEVS